MDANFITIGNFFVAIAIAYFAYQSNRLNKTIHQENKNHSEQIHRLYWGIIVSGILNIDEPMYRKRKLNILFTLFDVEDVVKNSKIPVTAFEKILDDIDGNQATEALKSYKDGNDK
jgi:uncharacterized membrane protein YwzB